MSAEAMNDGSCGDCRAHRETVRRVCTLEKKMIIAESDIKKKVPIYLLGAIIILFGLINGLDYYKSSKILDKVTTMETNVAIVTEKVSSNRQWFQYEINSLKETVNNLNNEIP